MQEAIVNEDKDWEWSYTLADKVRTGEEVEILTKVYHVMRVTTKDHHILSLRVKEEGTQNISEIELYDNTSIKYRVYDKSNFMDMLFGGEGE